MDSTEEVRRALVAEVNGSAAQERAEAESRYGKVWSAEELRAEFEVTGFAAPFVVVKRKSDGQTGSLMFQHMPRFYFDFVANEGSR